MPVPTHPSDGVTRVLIAGCGDVGTALGRLLSAEGHVVWGLRRNVSILPDCIRPVAADLTDRASLAALPRGLDAVVYTAAAPVRTDEAYRATYAQGLRNLLSALDQAGEAPGRLLFASSTGVYGQDDGSWVDEASPTEPKSFTGTRMLDAESVVRSATMAGVLIRFGGIYGPGRTRLIERARSGEATLTPPRFTNRIHVDDCARALAHLLRLHDPEPVYLAADDEPSELDAVIDFIRARAGWPRTVRPAADRTPVAGKRCSNRRLRATGFRFRYPTFRQGYSELVDAAR